MLMAENQDFVDGPRFRALRAVRAGKDRPAEQAERKSGRAMPTKEELGRRLRAARFERNLTLKQVANRCGMSATHISEVERGKTSPTIGALQRISAALGEKPAFFVREDVLEPVAFTPVTAQCEYFVSTRERSPVIVQMVARGIPGGCMQIMRRLSRPGDRSDAPERVGEMVVLCLRGSLKLDVGGTSTVLREGDALQMRIDDGFAVEVVGDEEAEGLWVMAAPSILPT
jgi:transcriptional regulator with XRE-family HTH domain